MTESNTLTDQFSLKSFSKIVDIDQQQWNSLVPDNYPFIKHQFLAALEQHQCVGEKFGWIPRHLGVFEQQKLVAAIPLYEKHNYYGEFVFDQAWENAWHQIGRSYYPKLVSAIPYTPTHGPRLLIDPNYTESQQLRDVLVEAMQALCLQTDNSGCHILWLFP